MSGPYYRDEQVTLWLGDCRDVLPTLGGRYDCAIADPPYGETSLVWDRWPRQWTKTVAEMTASMWCFGSLRTFGMHWSEFGYDGWVMSQDVVWEKHNGSAFHADRFKRVHEHAVHWYLPPWADRYHETPTTPDAVAKQVRRKQRPTHTGDIDRGWYTSEDGGPRLMRSVIAVRSMHGRAIHPTEKPVGILQPLLEYACPTGGVVLDPFAGSGSTAVAARLTGRSAVLVEADESYCEKIANRLSQGVLIEEAS